MSTKFELYEISHMNSSVRFETIELAHVGQRVDNFLLSQLKGLPKSRLYRLIRKGEIRVNKGRIKPEYRLVMGDVVRIPPIRLAPPKVQRHNETLFQGLMQRVIYEDKQLLVLNKPQGIAVHGGTSQDSGLIECLKIGLNNQKLELIHRLDKDTSGCLLIAKNRLALKFYHEKMRHREIEKHYLALTHGHWPKHLQKVDLPLARKDATNNSAKMVRVAEDGQQAVTYFSPMAYFENATLLKVRLQTGRTHQIRVHTSANDRPIVGDDKYGTRRLDKILSHIPIKRLFLHAFSVSFPLYESEKIHTIETNPGDYWQQFLETL